MRRRALADLLRPPPLRVGDTIGVCTPSAPAHTRFREKYLHGLAVLRGLGFEVIEGPLTASVVDEGHRAGTPEARADEIHALFLNPDVRAIITTIGGNCSASVVPHLDFDLIRAHPKVFCGYSDITALHLAFQRHAGLSTFYGPAVMPSFGEWPDAVAETRESFLDAVMRHREGPRVLRPPSRWSRHFRDAATDAWRTLPREWLPHHGWRVVVPGTAVGPALACNLSTLLANAGTPEFPDLRGAVLFIEDMATAPDLAERRFRHLAALGAFRSIAGLVWGRVEHLTGDPASPPLEELLLEAIGGPPSFPVVFDFDGSHTVPMVTLAQGTPVHLRAPPQGSAELTVLRPMVAADGR